MKDIVRELLPLPGTNRMLPSLSRMRKLGNHIALVVDEYGGTAGIVTLEDRVRVTNGSVDGDGGLILQEFESVSGI